MATTIATAAADVEARLNLAPTASATEFTSTQIEVELRRAFRKVINNVQPIFLLEDAIDANLEAVVTDLGTVVHVEINRKPLFWNEYHVMDDAVRILSLGDAISGNTAVVWYTKNAEINAASDATIETTCIHGGDFLEEAALLECEKQIFIRMSMTNDSGQSMLETQRYRMLQEDLNQELARLVQVRNSDLTLLRQRLEDRARLDPFSDWNEIEIEPEITNYTTGVHG